MDVFALGRKDRRMTTQLQLRLGDRTRSLRAATGASQEAFAQLADIDRASYGKLERGELNPALITLARVSVALNISLSELLEGIDVPAEDIRALLRSKRGRPRS